MRLMRISLLSTILLASCAIAASAQNQTSAAQPVENLRAQLQNLQSKEDALQARSRQLDEDLKPENIEKYFALNGSTHPEELREQRRRQLEAEKSNVTAQLEQIAASRSRLESAIATAEAAAYRQSTSAPSTLQPSGSISATQPASASSSRSTHRTHRKHSRRARTKH